MLLAKLVCFTMTCHVQECAQHFSQKKKEKKKSIYINSYGAQSDPFQTNNTY